MTRPVIAILLAAAFAFPAFAGERLPPQLKGHAVVDGDIIRLGDLWENLDERADTAIANAPQPGKKVTLDARWLSAMAAGHNVDWRPATIFDRSVVERAGQTIDYRTIETELREALIMEGAPAGAAIEVANRTSLQMVIPSSATPTIAVRDVIYDPRMNRFTASVEAPAGSPSAVRLKVSGRVFSTLKLPTLSRIMNRGDVITEADIEWIEAREEQVRRDSVVDVRRLVGMEPRYQIRAGAPIREADLQRPVQVAKGSAVTITLRSKFMTLTAQGRAVEDGSKGDTIRITNLQTKQVIEARVDGPGLVSVMPGAQRQLTN